MKVAICSDIHLEFGPLPIENTDGADVLILAGDICVAESFTTPVLAKGYFEFFEQCSTQFKDVIYVMGNHEHYSGDICNSYDLLKDSLEEYQNIHILENEERIIGDYAFIGQTLWTDMNDEENHTMYYVSKRMNDFQIIKNSEKNRKLSPQDTVDIHKKSLANLLESLERNKDKHVIVVGHHAPSHYSVKPRYELDRELNGAYRSNLEWVMKQNRNIKLWVHGHTHHEFDYKVHDSRVVCNPRGYVGYERGSHDEDPYTPMVIKV